MIDVDVCICTHQRDSLEQTLRSLAQQNGAGIRLQVIVADNDDHPSRRERIENLCDLIGLDLRYIHAPAHNISIARNACLDSADGHWIAFLDDDEVASPTWLQELLCSRNGRDIVFGVSQAIYASDAPEWITRGDFHSNRRSGRDPHWNGYTANVLMNRHFCESVGLRFNPHLGRTGGEDTLFFYEAMCAGARFGYAPAAVVTEFTEPSKASMRWLLLRKFRSGQTHALLLRKERKSLGGTLAATAKFGWSIVAAAISFPVPVEAARHLLRSALHAGVVAGGLGFATYREFNGRPATRHAKPSFRQAP